MIRFKGSIISLDAFFSLNKYTNEINVPEKKHIEEKELKKEENKVFENIENDNII